MGQRTIQVSLYLLMVFSSHGRDVTAFPISPMLFVYCMRKRLHFFLLLGYDSLFTVADLAFICFGCTRLRMPS